MTKNDILDYFKDINYVYNNSNQLDTLSSMIDELLKEQEAVKPIFIETTRTHEAGFMEVSIKCGNCKSKVQYYPERWKYCPNCGRKVKWDERPGKGNQRA